MVTDNDAWSLCILVQACALALIKLESIMSYNLFRVETETAANSYYAELESKW